MFHFNVRGLGNRLNHVALAASGVEIWWQPNYISFSGGPEVNRHTRSAEQ